MKNQYFTFISSLKLKTNEEVTSYCLQFGNGLLDQHDSNSESRIERNQPGT